MLRQRSIAMAPAVAVASLAAVLVVYEIKRDDWAEPDLKAMRSYRASALSDAELRRLHDKAVSDADDYKKIDQAGRTKEFQRIAATTERCKDFVYRERDVAECNRGLPIGLMYMDSRLTPSPDQLFEEAVLGVCRFMKTKEQARLNSCLAPGK